METENHEYFRPQVKEKLRTRMRMASLKKNLEMREWISKIVEQALKKEGI
jgi:hypothetical protein